MSAPIALVAKPTVAEEVRESVVRLLRGTLAEAEAGEVSTVVILVGHINGDWFSRCSDTEHFSEAVGRVEIIKQEWIAQYLRDRE